MKVCDRHPYVQAAHTAVFSETVKFDLCVSCFDEIHKWIAVGEPLIGVAPEAQTESETPKRGRRK